MAVRCSKGAAQAGDLAMLAHEPEPGPSKELATVFENPDGSVRTAKSSALPPPVCLQLSQAEALLDG